MPRYIAFLRAINVGGHTVKMDRLRQLFEALGLARVETFIASGNVSFESSARNTQSLEKKIERHLEQALGYAVAAFLRTPAELAAVAAYQPFAAKELEAAGHHLYIGFVAAPPGRDAQQKLLAFRTAVDDFHLHGRELYWLRRTRIGESKITGGMLEKALGTPSTLRNVTTVRKLAAKYPVPL